MATIKRTPRRDTVLRQPRAVPGEPGLFIVDATWGAIQPSELPGGVAAVAELEVLDHLRAGGTLIDCRQPDQVSNGTLPGATPIPHQQLVERLPAIAGEGTVVLFCNGPQCTATPQGVVALLAAGWDSSRLRYYRGGIHDWVTLGLPLTRA
jgi:rhodanese-related sulfurtransferase